MADKSAPPLPPLPAPPVKPAHPHSPGFRNLVHFGVFFAVGVPMIGLVQLLKKGYEGSEWVAYIPYWISGFLAAVTLFNAFVLRHVPVMNRLVREDEPWHSGLWIYPCSLAVCFALFPLYAAFGAWAVMACGDAPASFFGRLFSGHKLPWNEKKTVAGFIGFLVCAVCGSYVSLYCMPCPFFLKDGWPETGYVWALAVLASLSGVLAESFDTRLDDNVRVPFASGATVVLASYFLKYSTANLPEGTHVQPENLVRGLLANAALGAAVLLLGFADFPATMLGVMLGTLIFFYANWQGFVLFVLFVGLGSVLSKIGLKRKQANHTAEAHEGKRGIGNAAANLLVPALCCALYPLLYGRPSLLMAFAGAISAALADTASSEIGVLSPREPVLITTFKPVPHGTNGAVSLLGTAGAVAASALIGTVACATGFVQLVLGAERLHAWPAFIGAGVGLGLAGMIGTFVDSLLGATLEGNVRFIGKGAVNFACTLTGALFAAAATELGLYIASVW